MSESPQPPTVATKGEGAVRRKPGMWTEETGTRQEGFNDQEQPLSPFPFTKLYVSGGQVCG